MCCIISFMTWNKMRYFKKPINNHKYRIPTPFDLGKPNTKFIDMLVQGSLGIGKEYTNHEA